MFLGQIASAIFNNKTFEMTSGEQLREYHHIEDDAQAIGWLLNSNTSGIVQISHGHPIKLATMATEIFKHFNCVNLLEIGAKNDTDNENMMTSFHKKTYLDGIHFRNTIDGVISYLSRLLDSYEAE
jgi:nucleoside-diphosphate-sugar epimerase